MTTTATTTKPKDTRTEGCWLAYDSGFNTTAVFSSEVQALRWAVERGLHVTRVPFGVDLKQAIAKAKTEAPTAPERDTTP